MRAASDSCSARRASCRSAPARWRASTSPPTAASWPRARFAGVAPNSIDAVSNRDFVLDFLAAAATCATHLSRLGAELVLWSSRGVRVLPRRRRLVVGLLSCRRRRIPTRPSCCGPRRRAWSRGWWRCTACCTALPLTYIKDMQEDKEHLFDAVDTLDLCLQAATGMTAGIASTARARRRRRRRADRRDRHRRPARPAAASRSAQSHGIVAGHRARDASTPGARCPSSPARSWRATPSALDDEFYAVLVAAARGSSRRCPRAAPRWPRVREQLSPRARGARRPARVERCSPATSTTRPVLEVAPRPASAASLAPRRHAPG